jgi:hypothetical protein
MNLNLTETAQLVKKILPFVILGIIFILILYFGIQIAILASKNNPSSENEVTPTPILRPLFKQIPKPYLSEAIPSSRFKSYVLDTIDGVPITATTSAKVFFLKQNTINITYRSQSFSMAKAIGFNTETTKYQDKKDKQRFIFKDGKRTLTIDTANFNFEYQYKLTNDNPLLKTERMPTEDTAISKAIEFLESINKYPRGLSKGTPTVHYMKYNTEEKQLNVVEEANEANMVEVDFRREDIRNKGEDYPIVSPNHFNTQNYVVMIFEQENLRKPQIIRAKINYYPKDSKQVGIYPLKTGKQAWNELIEGNGYIVSPPPDKTEKVKVKNMYLGYLNPEGYEPYLQPVYVFLGEGDFVAYVPAITEQYLLPPEENKESKIESQNASKSAETKKEKQSSTNSAETDQ